MGQQGLHGNRGPDGRSASRPSIRPLSGAMRGRVRCNGSRISSTTTTTLTWATSTILIRPLRSPDPLRIRVEKLRRSLQNCRSRVVEAGSVTVSAMPRWMFCARRWPWPAAAFASTRTTRTPHKLAVPGSRTQGIPRTGSGGDRRSTARCQPCPRSASALSPSGRCWPRWAQSPSSGSGESLRAGPGGARRSRAADPMAGARPGPRSGPGSSARAQPGVRIVNALAADVAALGNAGAAFLHHFPGPGSPSAFHRARPRRRAGSSTARHRHRRHPGR